MPSNNLAIIVLGMHRSGTSALTAAISMLGITPGTNLQPPEVEVNAKGFWEHTDIVSLHDQLLEALGSSWHDDRPLPDQWWKSPDVIKFRQNILDILHRDFSCESMWLIKDPRMCRLLPLWRDVLRELACQPKYILVLRHPGEVALSLRKRDGLTEEQTCLLWLVHMLEAEYWTRGQTRVLVSYNCLLEDWQREATTIGQNLGITWPVSVEAATTSINAFLDPSLCHYAGHTELPDHPACRLALKVFEQLSALRPDPSRLDQLHSQVMELIAVISPWSKRLQLINRQNYNLRYSNAKLDLENRALRMEVARIKSTVSWRITKPLRGLWNVLRLQLQHGSAKR
jgi:hypothetical protein